MDMITITSVELQRNFGKYQDEALAHPVSITRNGRERIVMLSADEYRRLKRRAREVIKTTDLSEADLQAIKKSKMAKRHAHLDDELK
jgi:prevent-host-death family protein